MAIAKVHDYEFTYTNAEEFRTLRREIFTQHQYYVDLKTSKPRIIDAGAHIGLATGYFKWLYPDAEIVAIEPNPRLIPLLEQNVAVNQWRGVTIIEAALTDSGRGEVPFYFDVTADRWYSTGGLVKGAWNGKQASFKISVPGRPLTDWLDKPVDLLKLDIEGAETTVLQATGDKLRVIRHMVMEYHPVPGNALEAIKQLFTRQGFKLKVSGEHERDEGLLLVEAHRLG